MPRKKHSTLSADTLFHFTRTKENLISILQNEFYPRYALENWNLVEPEIPERHIAIPMVSFCDIPLSQVGDHIEPYGEYALGLTKEWAKSKGIAPVLYSYSAAHTSLDIVNIFQNLPPISQSQNFNDLQDVQRNLVHFAFHIKKYEGYMYKNGRYTNELIRFYDEREWRYVPPIDLLMQDHLNSFLPKFMFDNENQRNIENHNLSLAISLGFRPKYIRYVIVKSENEILEIMDAILSIKGDKFPYNEVRELTTRIISMERILSDF